MTPTSSRRSAGPAGLAAAVASLLLLPACLPLDPPGSPPGDGSAPGQDSPPGVVSPPADGSPPSALPSPAPEPSPSLQPSPPAPAPVPSGSPSPTPAAGGPPLAADCERIAWDGDGNYHDRDDIGASAMAIALLAEQQQQARLAHWSYSSHLGSSDERAEADMTTAVLGTAERFGYDLAVFHDSQEDLDAAVVSLRAAIDASTPGDRLCLLAAGPMGVVYRAVDGSDPAARPHVTLVSHSDWNNEHDDDENRYDLADIRRDFPQVDYRRIPDQNRDLGTGGGVGKWSWLAESADPGLRWLFEVVDEVMDKQGDVSDSGMMYAVVTGDERGTPEDYRAFLD